MSLLHKKLIVWVFAGAAGLGATFGLISRYSDKGSVMSFLGLKNQDVTEDFRKTLYRTANSEVVEGQEEKVADQARVSRLQYGEDSKLFRKSEDWGVAKARPKVEKLQDVEGPLDLIKNETKQVVSTKMVSTLQDMGVDLNPESLPPMDQGSPETRNNAESSRLVSAMPELKNAKPLTKRESRLLNRQAPLKSKIKGSSSVNTVRGAVSGKGGAEWRRLRASARMSQFAVGSGDEDAVGLLGGAAIGSGADIGPAIGQLADRGELGGITGDDVQTMANQFLQAIGLGGDLGLSPGGKTGPTDQGIPQKQFSPLNPDLLAGLIPGSGAEDAVCPICDTVSLDDDLIIGPQAPTGLNARVSDSSLSRSVSLEDLQGSSGSGRTTAGSSDISGRSVSTDSGQTSGAADRSSPDSGTASSRSSEDSTQTTTRTTDSSSSGSTPRSSGGSSTRRAR